MPLPWFLILCPACGEFWREHGRFPPDGSLLTPCRNCGKDIAIEFAYARNGALTIESVIDFATMEEGDWSPLLERPEHGREVN